MANITGVVLPGAYSDVVTQSRGIAVPVGSRITAMIGEGSTDEVLISQANGGGNDGLNPTYTSTTGADGRHFQSVNFPLISNRSTLYKNGIPLVGLEASIDTNPFSNNYDYRIDITNGQIELQRAHIVDQGGDFYIPFTTNVGLGTIDNLELDDPNAQPETWSIRCIGVQRNVSNVPIAGTAKFIAIGSISGALIDPNGNPYVWTANGVVVSNGILSFSIEETEVMSVAVSPFREGDGFTIMIASGVLVRSDSLTLNCIPELNINDPVTVNGMLDCVARHGSPSTTNNLSLGAQLAFANAAPSLVTCQAAPPMPRRTSYILETSVDSLSDNPDDFIFPLPIGVTPDANSNIHFFVTNNTTNVEQQILPNKLPFYTLDTSGNPTTNDFIFDDTGAPAGYSYFYTVVQSFAAIATGEDGYIGRDLAYTNKGVFGASITFDSTYIGKTLKIIDAVNVANKGLYTVDNVHNGNLYVTHETFPDFTNETGVSFEIVDPTTLEPVADANDGAIVAIISSATANFTSDAGTGVDFGTVTNLLNMKLQINGSDDNNGLYDIISYDSGPNTIVIRKVIVNESNMRYEVLDVTDESNYIVINHNVVPNGYQLRVTIVDRKDASFYDPGWINALESLEPVECDILVPLPKQTISVIFQNALNHCKTMSNIRNRKERILFIGAINGLTPENLTGEEEAAVEDIGILEGIQGETVTDVLAGNVEDLANYSVADAFGNTYRCVYFYPDQIVVSTGVDNLLIDGFYQAAAAAGYESADIRLENPLTNKVLSGFTILRNKLLSTSDMEDLAQAGVTVVQPVQGGGRVVWGITTTQSGFPEEQEISVVFIRDRIAKLLRAGFAGFIGTPESPQTQAILNTRAVVLLNSLVDSNLITGFRDLTVARDSVDPRQWNVGVRVAPVYAINWIYIKVAVGEL